MKNRIFIEDETKGRKKARKLIHWIKDREDKK
jgi:hypothetical protein